MKAILHANCYDFETYMPDCYVLFGGPNATCITEVGPMKNFSKEKADETTDAAGCVLMPGLVIGHGHLYSAFVRGLSLPFSPGTFTQLLRQLWWRMDAGIDLETCYHSAKVYAVEHVKNGVTTLLDHHAGGTVRGSLGELKRAFTDEGGLRALYCFETSNRFPVEACIEENTRFAREMRSEKCRGLFGLHASLSLSQESLEKVAKAQGDIPLHVHVGESLEDEVECQNNYGARIVQRFDSFGLLKEDSLLAHCVNIDETEMDLIAKRGCTVAVNPTSNMNTAVGMPNVPLLQSKGIPVMVGNDSLGTNITRCYQNLLYGMHLKSGSAWKFGYNDLLACIQEAYRYASRMLGVKLGRIAPGYQADLVVVPYHVATVMDEKNAFANLVDGVFNGWRPRDVFVAGEEKMRGYQTVYDEEKIYADARACTQKYWKRIGGL